VLNFKIKEGDVQGVEVNDLLFAIVGDTPKHMPEGGWRIGCCLTIVRPRSRRASWARC